MTKLDPTNVLTALTVLAGIGVGTTLAAGQDAAGGLFAGVAVVLLALLVRSAARDLGRHQAGVRTELTEIDAKASQLAAQADLIIQGNRRAARIAINQANRVEEATGAMERRILTDLNAARLEAADRA